MHGDDKTQRDGEPFENEQSFWPTPSRGPEYDNLGRPRDSMRFIWHESSCGDGPHPPITADGRKGGQQVRQLCR